MKLLLFFGRAVLNIIYFFHKAAPVKNQICLVSRQSDTPSLDIVMLEAELTRQSPETEIRVLCRMIGPGIKGKISYFFHMITTQMHMFATSRVIVLDGYCINACVLKHKKSLKIVQMWHAMGALKKFGWLSVDKNGGYPETIAKGMRMHKNYDVVFVGSEACKPIMAPAFSCSEKIMEVMPLPRCDLILSKEYNEEIRAQIYEKFPQIKEKKVILYAPTFRKNADIKPYVEELIEAVDYEDYALIVKLHPLDKERIASNKAIIDSDFSSMQWLSSADYVVTDYSAIVFEAALAGKPIYRYAPDMERYSVCQGLTDVFFEVPGPISKDTENVICAIESEECDLGAVQAFADEYICADGKSSIAMAGCLLCIAGRKK